MREGEAVGRGPCSECGHETCALCFTCKPPVRLCWQSQCEARHDAATGHSNSTATVAGPSKPTP